MAELKEKKLTKKDRFNILLGYKEVQANEDMVKFIENEIDLLNRKNSVDRKPTATQKENAELKEQILNLLADGKARTCTEILKALPIFEEKGYQLPKVSALVTQMYDKGNGVVDRIEDKRKAYFKLKV